MDRNKRLIEGFGGKKLDALLVSNEVNVTYMSGFTGDDSILLITLANKYMLTDFRYTEQAEKECPGFEIIKCDKAKRFEKISELLKKENIKRLGFEQHVSYSDYEKLKAALEDAKLVPTDNIIEKLRYIKDEKEKSYIMKAQEIADSAFSNIIKFIKPGMTEKQVTAELEYLMKKGGADGPAFDTLLISGKKTSLPHGKPSDKKIDEGDFVTLDFGALYKGYRSDMTRTIAVGGVSERQAKIYGIVKKAQLNALKALKAGINGKVPDDAAREVIGAEGYNDNFGHGLGHGVGLEIHEEPYMGKNSKYKLEEGCIVTVEPGIYIPGWGGVRIEDTVLVTKEGCEIFTKSSKDLIVI